MENLATDTRPLATLSIVSHGHASMIDHLLDDIMKSVDIPCEIILIINIPEEEEYLAKYQELNIKIVRNKSPKGFGANHNISFGLSNSPFFVIVNPDIRATPFHLAPLIQAFANPSVGAAGPLIVDSLGRTQDSARKFPTIYNMIKRKFGSGTLDYSLNEENIEVDWLAGMLVAFRSDAYKAVQGFDTNYFMYAEDADICWKLKQVGMKVLFVGITCFTHDAQRNSHKEIKHLLWHVKSLFRFNLKMLGILS